MVFSDNIATLIHDLKTPIIAQERTLDLLLQNTFGTLNQNQAEIISQIKESCLYLHNIVTSAMQVYISDNKINISPEYFNFKEILSSVINNIKPLAREKSLHFVFTSDKKDIIYADKLQIKRVISNLISNAVKYSYNNSKIKIRYSKSDNKFCFAIQNSAPEIKNIDKVFDKFESTTNSGLGLFLVKQVIELHKGFVFAQKENENEYSFGFVIPNV